jgi:hypothetical protein
MRSLLQAVGILVLAASVARADAILYSTAASSNGVMGFCVHNDGSLDGSPKVSIATAGANPRRLVVAGDASTPSRTLYVAETDRVEAFRIGTHGGLVSLGGTKVLGPPNKMDPLDIALSPDLRMLYVPQNGQRRIAAYPLNADGTFAITTNGPFSGDFSSCIQGPTGPRYKRMAVRDGLLYITETANNGAVAIYPLTADANGLLQLQLAPADCHVGKNPSETTCPLSERRRIFSPGGFVFANSKIYVESFFNHQIFAYDLTNGLFDPQYPQLKKKPHTPVSVCLKNPDGTAIKGPFKWQPSSSKTSPADKYQDIVFQNGTILGSQFNAGRIDAFRLKSDGKLPSMITQSTNANVRGTPGGLAVRGNVLYVSGGEFDRVQVFGLGMTNALPQGNPYSETDVISGSFPNALALAELPDSCP